MHVEVMSDQAGGTWQFTGGPSN